MAARRIRPLFPRPGQQRLKVNRQIRPPTGPRKRRVDFRRQCRFRKRLQPTQHRLENLRVDCRIRPHAKIQHRRRTPHPSHAQTRAGRPETQAAFPTPSVGNQPQRVVMFVGFRAVENHNIQQPINHRAHSGHREGNKNPSSCSSSVFSVFSVLHSVLWSGCPHQLFGFLAS